MVASAASRGSVGVLGSPLPLAIGAGIATGGGGGDTEACRLLEQAARASASAGSRREAANQDLSIPSNLAARRHLGPARRGYCVSASSQTRMKATRPFGVEASWTLTSGTPAAVRLVHPPPWATRGSPSKVSAPP